MAARSTNSSYGRWDEARKMWGLVVNRSRDFARQGLGYIPDSQPELQSMLVRWTMAYRWVQWWLVWSGWQLIDLLSHVCSRWPSQGQPQCSRSLVH